jgi:hypothetical protein
VIISLIIGHLIRKNHAIQWRRERCALGALHLRSAALVEHINFENQDVKSRIVRGMHP